MTSARNPKQGFSSPAALERNSRSTALGWSPSLPLFQHRLNGHQYSVLTALWQKCIPSTPLTLELCVVRILAVFLTLMNAMGAQPSDAFKEYLSSEPCISKIRFSEIACDNATVAKEYVGAVCGQNFFLRQLQAGDNPKFPISLTNRNRSSFFVGRSKSMRWQIADYEVTRSYDPNERKPDAYTVGSDHLRLVFNDLLGMGAQHLEVGSAKWERNTYYALPFATYRQFATTEESLKRLFRGEVTITDGNVTGMALPASGKFKYSYDALKKLPVGIPSEIIWSDKIGGCLKKISIAEFQFGTTADDLSHMFEPDFHIVSEAAIPSVLSNSIFVSRAKPGKATLNKIWLDHQVYVTPKRSRLFATQRYIIFGFMGASVVMLVLLVFKKRAK